MASFSSLFCRYLSLLFLHLACFNFSSSSSSSSSSSRHSSKKRKLFPFSSNNKQYQSSPPSPHSPPNSRVRLRLATGKAFSSSWCFLKRIFATKSCSTNKSSSSPINRPLNKLSIPSPCSSTRSLTHPIVAGAPLSSAENPPSECPNDVVSSSDQQFFPLRNDIYPCTLCGEIFPKSNLLEQHQSIKHAVSELLDGDTGKNIVKIIFKSGWPDKKKDPTIHRILKIHNSPKILTRFEEFRECVISKAAASKNGAAAAARRRDERCIADGNELLRFHCTTFLCELGINSSDLCNQQYCSVCGIIRTGFSPKMDGISTMSTSWRAHMSMPEEIEEEFKFMHVKRAMLVCRVIAGRVGCDPDIADKEDPGYDSLVGCRGNEIHMMTRLDEDDELLVFNPRAVLPCFVIVYSV